MGVIKTLTTRASRISDPEHLDEELIHLHEVFVSNGYQHHTIRKIITDSLTNKQIKRKSFENPRISLPYIKGTTDKISKVLAKHNIMVAFTPPNTIKNMLSLLKMQLTQKITKAFIQFSVCAVKFI